MDSPFRGPGLSTGNYPVNLNLTGAGAPVRKSFVMTSHAGDRGTGSAQAHCKPASGMLIVADFLRLSLAQAILLTMAPAALKDDPAPGGAT